jgi:hypothetical protein
VESTIKKKLKNNKNMTKDHNSEGVRHQEGPFLPGMRTIKRELKNNRNITPPAGTKDQNSEGVKHQEGHFLSGMRIFFLVIVILAETLDTKQFTAKSMQETTI